MRRIRQLTYVVAHPVAHTRCAAAVARSRSNRSHWSSLKYLGNHLALSLGTSERREALLQHHLISTRALSADAVSKLRDGVVLWRREISGSPPLSLALNPSKLAPMEGELELTFTFRSELYVLTFLFGPGYLFSSPNSRRVLFIGGLQGRYGAREEIREASRLNHEIAPATMLLMAVRAIARAIGASELLAIGETDHVSMSYSASMVRFDYGTCWSEVGASRTERFYSLPIETRPKPLSLVSRSHRSRARRKQEEKQRISDQIESRVRELINAPATVMP